MGIVCNSFAKSMGLYGERVGSFNVVCSTQSEAEAVLSKIKMRVVRPNYSSPPLHGARIATAVLGNDELRQLWLEELKQVSGRIQRVRSDLVAELERIQAGGAKHSWDHISSQIGMSAFSGLEARHVDALLEQHRVYLTRDGRLTLASLCSKDIPYVANAIKLVLAA